MASCSAIAKAYGVSGNLRNVSIRLESKELLLPKPSYGSYLRLTEAVGSQKRASSLKSKSGLVVAAKGADGGKSGTIKGKAGTVSNASKGGTQKLVGTLKLLFGGADDRFARELPRDDSLVFVAGATGRVGSRTVRELVKLGFKVRAGVRNIEKAEEILADLLQEDRQKGIFARLPIFGGNRKQIELVEADLESTENLEEAIGAAGKVVCAIGAAENDALNVTGPYRIDGKATKNLIKAAMEVEVNQFVLISSLGITKFGFPASLLNLFWGVLIWKAQAEKELRESGIAFTIVRPGGMERPKDDYKLTHNLQLAPADTFTGGQVSNLQIAELVAGILANPEISENKIVEAIAETTAPIRPIPDMLEEIPIVGLSQADRLEILRKKAEKLAQEEAEQEALEIQRQTEEKEALERQIVEERQAALRAKLSKELAAAKEKQKLVLQEAEATAVEKAQLEKRRAELKAKALAAAQTAQELRALQEAVLIAAKQGKILSTAEKDAVIAKARESFLEKNKETVPQKLTSNVPAGKSQLFGGITPWNRAVEVSKIAENAVVEAPKPEKKTAKPEIPKTVQTEPTEAESPKPEISKTESVAPASAKKEEGEKKKSVTVSVEDARAVAEKKVRERLAKQAEERAKGEEEERVKAERIAKVKAEGEAKEREEQERVEAAVKEKQRVEDEEREVAEKLKVEAVEKERKRVEEEEREKERKEEETRLEAEKVAKLEAEEQAKKDAQEEEAKVKAEKIAKLEEEKKLAEEQQKLKAEKKLAEKQAIEEERKALSAKQKAEKSEELKKAKERLAEEAIKAALAQDANLSTKADPIFIKPEEKVTAKSSTDFPPSPTPLSPYTRYEDLKPPSSPTPSPPAPTEGSTKTENPVSSSTDFPPSPTPLSPYTQYEDLKPPTSPTPKPPISAAENTAEKPKSGGFRWPWQKPDTESSPEIISDNGAPSSPVSFVTETETESKESSTDFPLSPTPLSPYTAYPDMKPPTSPTLSPPVATTEVEEVIKEEPAPPILSPPAPEKTKNDRPKWVSPLSSAKVSSSPPSTETEFRWPWQSQGEGEGEIGKVTNPSSTDLPYTNRPLSPYTMFPNLRPPSSPIPYSPDDL